VRAAVEQQFGMKPGTLKPPEVYVSVGWRLPLQKAPAYNRVGHPRCYW
jgi:hypothetical protein